MWMIIWINRKLPILPSEYFESVADNLIGITPQLGL